MTRVQNKVAVITGGNSGIGKGIAKRFLKEGAKVVIFGRDKDKLEQTKKELSDDILIVQGDVTKKEDLLNLFKQASSHFGKIDVLVSNAGVANRLHIEDADEEHFDRLVNTNYRGLFFTVKYALEHLNPGASIILIASTAAHMHFKRHSVYASTKAAVVKLAKNFAYDLSDQLIRVNSISPGYIKTPIFDARLEADPDYLKKREAITPLKRIGTPQDIANTALFLASDEASFITGTDIIVDGGYTASFPEVT